MKFRPPSAPIVARTIHSRCARARIPATGPSQTTTGTRHAVPTAVLDFCQLAQCRPALLSYARRRLDAHAAEDAVQDALLAALKARDAYRGSSTVHGWLIGILKHKIVDAVRWRAREGQLDWEEAPGFGHDPDGIATGPVAEMAGSAGIGFGGRTCPETALMDAQFMQVLGAGMDELPARWREVFLMREVRGMETEQICATLGISPNNCFVLLHRARRRLRLHLLRNGFGSSPARADADAGHDDGALFRGAPE